MKHCTECGAALEIRELKGEGMIPYCPVCEAWRFPVYATAVIMLVVDERAKKILLIQQYGRQDWILVAGYVTRGEAAEAAVAREVMEEVGLKVKRTVFNRSSFHERSNALMLNYTAYVSCEDPVTITDEVDRWQWFTYEEATAAIKPGSLAEEFLLRWLEDRKHDPAVTMCTCGDASCPNHPTCHDKGCTPCIAKNLALG